MKLILRPSIGLLLIATSSSLLLLVSLATPVSFVENLTTESGVVENLSAAAYLGAFINCIYLLFTTNRSSKKGLITCWAIITFIFFGEETSWCQHFFHYPTPGFLTTHNAQGETNLHNLVFWNAPAWHHGLSLSGNKFIKFFFSSANLFRLAFTFYFLFLPLSVKAFSRKTILNRLYVMPLDKTFLFSLWLIIGLSIGASLICSPDRIKPLSEVREMFYAFTIFFHALYYLEEPEKKLPPIISRFSDQVKRS